MDKNKLSLYRTQAETLIRRLETRKMDGYYCETMEEAKAKVLELIGEPGKSVAYGGSMTLDNSGIKQDIEAAGHQLVVRENYKTPEEKKELNSLQINADTFIMSTNAITMDGELINVDGFGNRVCYLIYGPEQVVVLASMDKVTMDLDSGIKRVRTVAAPANVHRLNCDTPCAKVGVCANCLKNSICSQVVITRTSMIPHRIKVVLVGEEAGL